MKRTAIGALVVLLAMGGLSTSALAQTKKEEGPVAQATAKAAEKDFIKVSDDAFNALRQVRASRLALFNGLPEVAKERADAALVDVAAAEKDAAKFALDVKKPMKEGDMYLPFDAQLAVADSFVPSEEKAEHISRANAHLKKGEKKQAIEVLKLAEIDVVFSTALVPVKSAKEHIEAAVALIDDGKYYEANLALKAVEDSVIVDTFGIDDVPGAAKPAKAAGK